MPGKLKEIRGRITSVTSTQQITIAMKMVSTAKLRKAQDRITFFKEYAEKLRKIVEDVVGSSTDSSHATKLTEVRQVKKALFVVISSDRGLCGAFNTNIFKKALHTIETDFSHLSKNDITILPIGKKAYEFFLRNKFNSITDHKDLLHEVNAENVAKVANRVMQQFLDGEFDAVRLVYSQFKNASVQNFASDILLPIAPIHPTSEKAVQTKDYIFEPPQEQLLAQILPQTIITQCMRAILDTTASEHGARMVAMEKASDNAKALLRELKLSYNKARQDAITTELSEIVAGAAAS